MDPIQPIARSDRTVQPVDLARLTPLERERQRREHERRRDQAGARGPERSSDRAVGPDSGIDVRA